MKTSTKTVKKIKLLPTPEVEELNDNYNKELDKKTASIGDKLCKLREEQEKSIRDIAKALRIGEHYLCAIEKMDRQALPERVYALGFVRSYSSYLGLDPQGSLAQFKEEMYGDYQAELLSLPEPLTEVSRANWKVLVVCASIIGLVIFSWYKLTHKTQVQEPAHTELAVRAAMEDQVKSSVEQPELEDVHVPLEEKQQVFPGLDQSSKRQNQNSPNISMIQDFQWLNLQNQVQGLSEEKAP